MTDRKKQVLKAIVNEYVMTAEPVGSRTLARRYDFGVGSATIRNEMADLEEMGYLEKPHKSAGRIPSDKGYRFYVDTLMELQKISKQQQQAIKENYESKAQEIHEIVDQTSEMLSELTKYTSLVLSPRIQKSVFRNLKLVPVDSQNALLILITDIGVQDRVVTMPQELNRSELQQIARYLSERLQGMTLNEIDQELLTQVESKLINRINSLDEGLDFLYQNLFTPSLSQQKIYLGGTTNILEQPEFNDLHKVKTVLRVLEEEELLRDILENISDDEMSGVKITIGQENEFDEIKDCSMVTATYKLNDRAIGKIGVLGPTRMQYSNAASMVEIVAKIVSSMLTDK